MLIAGLGAVAAVSALCLCVFAAGIALVYGSNQILPGVSAAGIAVGGMSEGEASRALAQQWQSQGITLRDENRSWRVAPSELGIMLDAGATAAAAADWGRTDGGLTALLSSLTGNATIKPMLNVDLGQATAYLESIRAEVELPAVNAGVRLVNGQVVASAAQTGRALNVTATAERLRINAAQELADGVLDLVMVHTTPAITDSSPLVAQANALLSSPFSVQGYDPIRDEWQTWSAPPEVWSGWLAADSSPNTSSGLTLSITPSGPRAFLEANSNFPDERYINVDEAIIAMQSAFAQNQLSATVRVWHGETTYTVHVGQTLAAIAEDIGIPYPYIQAANPGVNTDALSIGQTLTIPSKDILVPLEPIPHKRIIVNRTQQHLWAYENGQVVFDWVISTGLASSPTALGIFQVQSHDINAYADQWNLYMPHFMGFYHPGPNMDLWNGFHGFPTRGGGYLLWSGDLGHPVTYGCVLLSLENAEALYNWANEGVVVEIRA